MIDPQKIDTLTPPVNPEESDDKAIILGVQNGNEAALSELIRKFTSPLIRIAAGILDDEDASKDVV